MDVNLNYLKIFIEAAESNSISEVAKKTGYNSANISILIKKFEEQLGVTLFTRNPLKLTKIGKDIYECSRKGYRDIEFINTIIKNKNDIRYGDITIGCPLNLTKYYLMNSINNAQKDYPDLQITIDCNTNYKDIIQNISNNLIDFAVLDYNPLDANDIKDFKATELYKNDYILVSNQEKEIKDIKELNNYKYIVSEDNRYSTCTLRKCFEENIIELTTSIKCVMTEARVEACKLGLGIAYVLRNAVQKELEDQELFEVKVPFELPKTSITLIYIKNRLTQVDKEFIRKYLL